MTNLRKVLAVNLKLFRKNLGLTQANLAEMTNVTDNYIALIETGRRFPSVSMLERIAKALQKDTLELFSVKPAELPKKEILKKTILSDIEYILTIRLNESE